MIVNRCDVPPGAAGMAGGAGPLDGGQWTGGPLVAKVAGRWSGQNMADAVVGVGFGPYLAQRIAVSPPFLTSSIFHPCMISRMVLAVS